MTLPRIDFRKTKAYRLLESHFADISKKHMRDLFAADPARFEKYSIEWEGLVFDFSKNRIQDDTLNLLLELARECGIEQGREALFQGAPINETENRAVLHTALRNRSGKPVLVDGEDVMPEVEKVLGQMRVFSKEVIEGRFTGFTGKPIQHVVNIGIGGSNLGPQMVTEALKPYKNHLQIHYVSNIDGTHIGETLKKLDPETTLFLVVSKSFTTQETMENAKTARAWFLQEAGGDETQVAKHFVAVSTNTEAVQAFGIDPANMFRFWDWVGGRFSLWSAVGLSIVLSLGYDRFLELLQGGYEADEHFRLRPLRQNIPVLMGVLGIWYNNFFGAETHAILPYNQYLHRFSAYLQQGDMESNGKSVNRSGQRIDYQTGPIIWGETGTDGQHAFFQLIHQGTKLIPADLIACASSELSVGDHQRFLLSNFFAQSEALMNGRSLEEVQAAHRQPNSTQFTGEEDDRLEWLDQFKVFEGNRPTNSILIDRLTPKQLGKLIALYEHKIFVQGLIWNIFSYDQWGVELGKQLALKLQKELQSPEFTHHHDSSTNGLINTYKRWTQEMNTRRNP